jgi:hypothetical protein
VCAEASVLHISHDVLWEGQDAAKPGNAHSVGFIKTTDPSDAVQFRASFLNGRIFSARKNFVSVEVTQRQVTPDRQSRVPEIDYCWNVRLQRKVPIISDYEIFESQFLKEGDGLSVIETGQAYNDGLSLPDVALQLHMLYADLRPMRSKEFVASERDLTLNFSRLSVRGFLGELQLTLAS